MIFYFINLVVNWDEKDGYVFSSYENRDHDSAVELFNKIRLGETDGLTDAFLALKQKNPSLKLGALLTAVEYDNEGELPEGTRLLDACTL